VGLLIVPASLVVVAASSLVALALSLRGTLHRLIAAMLLTQAGITLIVLVTGAGLRTLDGGALAACALALAIAAGGAAVLRTDRATIRDRAAAAVREAVAAVRSLRRNPILLLLVAAAVAALAWRLILALRLPILDYDGLAYHLVTVDVWLQSGFIGRVPQVIWSDGYPANGELLTTWLMAFGRDDWLARLTGWLPLPMATLAVAGVARAIGAGRGWAVGAGLVFLITPAVIVLADSTYVDNIVGADLAAAWFFGLGSLRASEPGRRRTLLAVAGIATGLGVGTKASLIVPLAIFGLVVIGAAALRAGSRPMQVRAAALDTVWFGLPAAVLGGYWYIKNLVVFGDPLWPYDLGPFRGIGSITSVFRTPPELQGFGIAPWILRTWTGDLWAHSYAFDARTAGYGVIWLPILGLAIAGAVLLARRGQWVPIVGLAIPSLLTLLLIPVASGGPRYTPFVLIVGLALATVALSHLRPRPATVVGLGLTTAALFSLFIATRAPNERIVPGSARTSLGQLARLLVADDATRLNVGLWAECAGFGAIPHGATFATDGSRLPHLAIGHELDRHLALNVRPTTDPSVLRDEAAAVGATYLALLTAESQAAAAADASAFRVIGPVCRGVELVEVVRPG
jgi:hypothetical protein